MSRSYKKKPWFKDIRPKSKQKANRKVRRLLKKDLDLTIQNNLYKRLSQTWDICDYKFFLTWKEFFELYGKFGDYKKIREKWLRCYYRK